MERVVAMKKLGKMLGKSFGYRVDPKAPTAEERAAALQRLPALSAARQEAEKAMTDRKAAVLAADQEYQALVAAFRAAREAQGNAGSTARHFKITVGNSNGMFFHVKAEGDSWEDVIEKVNAEINRRAH